MYQEPKIILRQCKNVSLKQHFDFVFSQGWEDGSVDKHLVYVYEDRRLGP